MIDSFVYTSVGASNEESYAFVMKQEHPSAAVAIVRQTTSVLTLYAPNLYHGKYVVQRAYFLNPSVTIDDLFYQALAEATIKVASDPLFRVSTKLNLKSSAAVRAALQTMHQKDLEFFVNVCARRCQILSTPPVPKKPKPKPKINPKVKPH